MGMFGGLATIGTGVGVTLALVFVLASRFLFPTAGDPAAAPLAAVIYGAAAVLGALVFLVREDSESTHALKESLAAAFVASVIVVADPLTRPLLPVLPAYLLVVYLLCATLAAASRITGVATAAVLFATLSLAPVWAAPLVEYAGNPSWLSGLVIDSSPLTSLALALDLDYLRSTWFYGYSALGSMRYDYPGWAATIACLSLMPSALLIRSLLTATAYPMRPLVRFPREAHP